MYSFYEREITEAYRKENWGVALELLADCPDEIMDALIANEVVETSVERSRDVGVSLSSDDNSA